MTAPVFPSLLPHVVDPLWFNVDRPVDDEAELSQLELEHQAWLRSIADQSKDVIPIGKKASERFEDDDEFEEDNDDESETNDDDDDNELDSDDMNYEYRIQNADRDSPVDAEMEIADPNSESPPWLL